MDFYNFLFFLLIKTSFNKLLKVLHVFHLIHRQKINAYKKFFDNIVQWLVIKTQN